MRVRMSQNKSLKVLFAAAEASPLAKVGGLADVVGSLPKALRERGHDVRLIMPRYSCIAAMPFPLQPGVDTFQVQSMRRQETAWLERGTQDGVPIYFLGSHRYFDRPGVYGEKDDLERFYFFSRAVAAVLGSLGWQPDIIHCHDWHTAALPLWLRSQALPFPSLFTIHNLAYQGTFDPYFMEASELREEWGRWQGNAPPNPPLTLMSQGILQADAVSTVSPTYAGEILTPEYGEGLGDLLRYRRDRLFGIVNGIDYQEFNPTTDPHLAARYTVDTLEKKALNKAALQKRANLPQNPGVPLLGMVSRLDEQKGFDLLEKALGSILGKEDVQLVILGKGRPKYEELLAGMAKKLPSQMALFLAFDNTLAHLIYSGCDMFLMPSRFEPCGLGQLIAMRYGAIPIVRHTGGLVDTVEDLSPDLEKGNGFAFKPYEPEALLEAVKRALIAFRLKEPWRRLMTRVMSLDLSWQASAKKYEELYFQVLEWKKSLPVRR